jgi:hypothetical protein
MAKKLTQDQNIKLNGLAQKETSGKISAKEKLILNEYRKRGQFPKSGSVQNVAEASSPSTFTQGAGRMASDIAGEVGGIKAAKKILPKLGLFGKLASAGLGAFSGDLVGQKVAEQRDFKDLSVAEAGVSGVAPTVMNRAGAVLKAPGKAISNKFFEKLSGPLRSKEAGDAFVTTSRAGVTAPVNALIENNGLSIFHAIAKEAPFSGGIMRRHAGKVQDVFEANIRDFSQRFASKATKEESGEMLSRLLHDAAETITELRGKSAQNIKSSLPDLKIDLSSFGGKSNGSIDDVIALSEKLEGNKLIKLKRQTAKDIFEEGGIAGKEGIDISSIADETNVLFDFLTKNSDMYAGTMVKSLLQKNPEQLIEDLLKSGRPKTIRKAMEYLNKSQKDQIATHFLGTSKEGFALLGKSVNKEGALRFIEGNKLVSQIDNFVAGHGEEVGDAFLGKGGLSSLRKIGLELAETQGDTGSKAGTMAIFLSSPGAAGEIIRGAVGVGAATLGAGGVVAGVSDSPLTGLTMVIGGSALLFGPVAMAKFLTNKNVVDRLIMGVKKNEKDPTKLRTFVQSFVNQMTARGVDVHLSEKPLNEQKSEQAQAPTIMQALEGAAR